MWTNKAQEIKSIFRVIDPNNHTSETKTMNQIYFEKFDDEELIEEILAMDIGDDYFDQENQILYVRIPSFLSQKFFPQEEEDDFTTI